MCGIAGIWHVNGEELGLDKLQKFTNSLSARGPDGAGHQLFDNNTLGLGHRRLSILDVGVGGKQPMSYADERMWITYNGEIYNFIEIKKELEQKGYIFKTSSDTEILLAAYLEWNAACLEKLNGMFAFAIWDKKNESLFLARDRFGVKPLHYLFVPGKLFAFASETYAFQFLEGFNKEVSEKNLPIALVNPDYMEGSGHTIYKNIYQLLPGHKTVVYKYTTKIAQEKWWETKAHLATPSLNYNEQIEKFSELFTDACRIRLRSDVPVATALSGGMDSSAIYCIVNEILKSTAGKDRIAADAQQAFVAYFPGTPQDEKQYAEQVIRYTGGKATYVEPNYSNLVNEIITTTKRFDAIGGTPILCATDVYKAMYGAGYRVSMDGHGADEMLYGYKQMVFNAYQTAVLKGDTESAQDFAGTYSGLFFEKDQKQALGSLIAYGESITPSLVKKVANKLFPARMRRRNTKNIYDAYRSQSSRKNWIKSETGMYLEPLSASHFANYKTGDAEQDTYNLFHYTSLPVNLRDFDRAAMQNSIEIRSPFMDWRLVSYVFSLPTESKVGGGFTKRILRDAMKNRMPENIRARKLKIGLSAPLVNWFSGPMKEFIFDEINSTSFQQSAIWDGTQIKEHLEKKRIGGWSSFAECSQVWLYLNAHLLMQEKYQHAK